MQIAVLSDTHNNLSALQTAVSIIKTHGISRIIHCGDLTDPDTLNPLLDGFVVSYVFGNGDFASGSIRLQLHIADPRNTAEKEHQETIDQLKICAIHSHATGRLEYLSDSGTFDVIFFGHTHHRCDSVQGVTRLINPGALGVLCNEKRSFCIFDTLNQKNQFIYID